MLHSQFLREFIFRIFAAKVRLPYGQNMWPAWWMQWNGLKYGLNWPAVDEIDILEMYGGNKRPNMTDQCARETIHWNNQSNTMNPVHDKEMPTVWTTPDRSMLHNNSLVYWIEWTSTKIKIGLNEFTYSVIDTTNIPESINPVWAFSGPW